MSACANSQIDTGSPSTLCDLRWPTSAVLGSSAKTGKKGGAPSLRHKQGWPLGGLMTFIMGTWMLSPSGDREQTGLSPLPSL